MLKQAVDIDVSLDQWRLWLERADCTIQELQAARLRVELTDESGTAYCGTATWLPGVGNDLHSIILRGEGPLQQLDREGMGPTPST